jgi:hypothetical protein
MNDSPFHTWTRRRFGVTASGAMAAVLAAVACNDVTAKSGKRKKRRNRQKSRNQRCLALHQHCRPGNARPHCCAGLTCDRAVTLEGLLSQCCRQPQDVCTDTSDCCYPASCNAVAGLTGRHCCRQRQATCSSDTECCGDLRCEQVNQLAGNRCCGGEGTPCQEDADCCSRDISSCNLFTLRCERGT